MRAANLLAIALLALAAAPARGDECADAEDQATINACADKAYKASDTRLNRVYSQVMERLGDDGEARTRLQAAQRHWITFRDAECDFATAPSRDGSAYPMVRASCLQGLTDDRADHLEAYLACEEGDMSCPVPPE